MCNLDEQILLFIQENIRNPFLSRIFVPLTIAGNSGLLLISIGIILCIIRKTRRLGFVFLTALLTSFILNDIIIKNIIRRPRPFQVISELKILVKAPISFSFPSGHTSSFFACAVALVYASRKYAIFLLIIAFLMGLSRMYVGVHYPSDVLVGMIIGIASGISAVYFYKRLDNKRVKC